MKILFKYLLFLLFTFFEHFALDLTYRPLCTGVRSYSNCFAPAKNEPWGHFNLLSVPPF
jgi:hypothetical protein